MNPQPLLELDEVILHEVRMQLYLINNWLDLAVSEHVQQHWNRAVAHPDALGQAELHKVF